MPEGHTIHRLAREHGRWFAGEQVRVSSPQGRFAAGARLLDGRRLARTEAYGKHLFHHFDGAHSVHIHLGLFGKVLTHPGAEPVPRPTVRYRLSGRWGTVDLVGATICEVLVPDEVAAIRARLGPDPIRADADPERAWDALRRRRTATIGQALMDQRVLAGVGNVFRAEVLFVHGLHPERPVRDVERTTFDALWTTLVGWLRASVRRRRIITVARDELRVSWRHALDHGATYVYRQPACHRCGGAIRRWDLGGRWAYACEACQRPPRPSTVGT